MSRIGRAPITIPSGVEVKITDSNEVFVKGPLGELSEKINKELILKNEDGTITVERPNEKKRIRSLHGLSRTLIFNMMDGVTKGYEKKLEIVGTGYRAAKNGKNLDLVLGYSHPISMPDPDGITTEVPSQNEIIVKGINKQLVGNHAAKIRDWRRPEPYQGKGIKYKDEYVVRKEGKTGKKK